MATPGLQQQVLYQTSPGSRLGRIVVGGLLTQHTGVPEKPMRTMGNFAVVFLLNGEGAMRDARGTRAPLTPGNLLLVFPGIPHWYGPPKGSVWDEFFIVFSGPVFNVWQAQGLLDPAQPVRRLAPIDYWLRRMHEVVFAETGSLQQVCSLQRLLAEALEYSSDVVEPGWLARARSLLEAEDASLEHVARDLGMTYDTFRRRFAATTGMSPGHYHARKLMDKACVLMAAGELTNKEMAERLGFCDEFHFSRRFKQIMGLAATQFRAKMPRKPCR